MKLYFFLMRADFVVGEHIPVNINFITVVIIYLLRLLLLFLLNTLKM